MSKRDKKIGPNDEPGSLTTNPFAALAGQLPRDLPAAPPDTTPGTTQDTPQGTPNSRSASSSPSSPSQSLPTFTVQRTRKGGYPISLEKRPSGKVVTVIRNVSGDAEGLLKLLKKKCGAGGCLAEDGIEIQGDHRERIEAILRG